MNWIWFLAFWVCIELAAGKQGFGPGDQDWGYVTVRDKAHMFWWLYFVNPPIKTQNFSVFQKPLLIWLQGGPGVSSTGFGNFKEIGPLDDYLNPRNHTWVNYYNILFIDQPVGIGFSYVDSLAEYSTKRIFSFQNIRDIYHCIEHIWQKFGQLASVPTYIVGESYGGRMAVRLAQLWDRAQHNGWIQSNLKGIALGNSWISPIDSIRSWAPYLLEMGFVDSVGFTSIEEHVNKIVSATTRKKWKLAKKLMDVTVEVIANITDNVNLYNVLSEKHQEDCREYMNQARIGESKNETLYTNPLSHIMNVNVASALGNIRHRWKICSKKVYNLYIEDFVKPVTHTVEYLLNHTNLEIVVYHGHLDVIIPIESTLKWIENLRWKYLQKWRNESRTSIKVNGEIEGYVKSYRNLKMYWIIRAGHAVPKDNPSAILAILQAMTEAN